MWKRIFSGGLSPTKMCCADHLSVFAYAFPSSSRTMNYSNSTPQTPISDAPLKKISKGHVTNQPVLK